MRCLLKDFISPWIDGRLGKIQDGKAFKEFDRTNQKITDVPIAKNIELIIDFNLFYDSVIYDKKTEENKILQKKG